MDESDGKHHLNETNQIHCQHEYSDNTWKCAKCGYQILPGLIGKIAETGSGEIMTTVV